MLYKVVFRKRFDADGNEADRPETFVQPADGVILAAVKAEVIDPPAMHGQDALDEDDDFESLGTEAWEYEVADGREDEFIAALENSRMVLQYDVMDEAA